MLNLARGIAAAALLTIGAAAGAETAAAAPTMIVPASPGIDTSVQQINYYYRGREYCWYYDGWQGPGWYWCGYAWRRGYGWGSPVWGWNNWAWHGPRYHRGGHVPAHRFYGRTPGGHFYGRPGGHGGRRGGHRH